VARKPTIVDEKLLTKGEVRKLGLLRKQLGEEIADRAFLEWLRGKPTGADGATDAVAEAIATALTGAVATRGLKIPRGGYIVRRGRGRVIVERPEGE
jgi:hypothetical protein